MLLIPTVISHRAGHHFLNQIFGYVLNGIVTAAMIVSLALLINAVTDHTITPPQLLRSAAALWVSNILVFASWYWHLDAGGPYERARTPGHTDGAFLFPQMTLDPEVKAAAGELDWGTELRRLSVPRFQYEYCLFAYRRAGAIALGKDSDDDSSADFLAGDCSAGRTRGEYSLGKL